MFSSGKLKSKGVFYVTLWLIYYPPHFFKVKRAKRKVLSEDVTKEMCGLASSLNSELNSLEMIFEFSVFYFRLV